MLLDDCRAEDEMNRVVSVNGTDYEIIDLLGHGKGGYSYLASSDGKKAVLKQIHHEPCNYYTFGNKIEAEKNDYRRLKAAGIRIPVMFSVDDTSERIVKEYIEGPTIFDMVRDGISVEPFMIQIREMAELAKKSGLNIDYFPTNFVVRDNLIYSYGQLINFRKQTTKVSQIVLISIIILAVGTGGMYLAGFLCYGVIPYASPMMIAPVAKALAIINFFLLPVTTAFAEDGLYLGCGVNVIENKAMGIIVPAFFYALQHCFIPTLFDTRYVLYRFLSFLPLTIILCWYYQKKRNPVPIMAGHAIIDMMTVSWVLASSVIPGFYEKICGM